MLAAALARRAQGSRDRVPHADGVPLGAASSRCSALAIFYFAWDESIVTARGSRARRAVGRARRSRRCSGCSARSGSRSTTAASTRCSSRRSAASRSTSARRSGTWSSCRAMQAITIPALVAVLQSAARRRRFSRRRDRVARDGRHRGGGHAVQRDGGEHAAGRAAAADAQPAVLRAGRDGAAQATTRHDCRAAAGSKRWPWLKLLVAFDIVFVVACTLAFPYTLEE